MTVAEELGRVRPGTRVRVFHFEGSRPVATSGTLVGVAGGRVRVRPLGDGDDVLIGVASLSAFTLPGRQARWRLSDVSIARVLAGALLFGGFGFLVAAVVLFSGGERWFTAVWAGWALAGAVVGAFAKGIGNPLYLLDPWSSFGKIVVEKVEELGRRPGF